jgi:putative transposase
VVFRFIEAEKANHAVSTMCRVLEVSRSGYYAWSSRPPSERAVANAALVDEIRRVHAESDGTYGSRRVHAELRREGHEVNRKRIERLMRLEGIQGAYVPPKRRRNADCALGVDGVKVWPDLVKRDFQPDGPNQLWCSDMERHEALWTVR